MAGRVLVVDDEQSLRKVLAATLQREGYEVTVCGDGEEALSGDEGGTTLLWSLAERRVIKAFSAPGSAVSAVACVFKWLVVMSSGPAFLVSGGTE